RLCLDPPGDTQRRDNRSNESILRNEACARLTPPDPLHGGPCLRRGRRVTLPRSYPTHHARDIGGRAEGSTFSVLRSRPPFASPGGCSTGTFRRPLRPSFPGTCRPDEGASPSADCTRGSWVQTRQPD